MIVRSVLARQDLPAGVWDQFVDERPDGWWWHRETWIDYALAYCDGAVDNSVALADGAGVIAIAPCVQDARGSPSYGGQRHVAPVTGNVEFLLYVGGHLTATMAWRPGATARVRVQPGFALTIKRSYVLDLRQPESDLWRGVRRSYHSLIHRAERRYDISVFSQIDGGIAATLLCRAREVHREQAGRETRSIVTWMLQADWLAQGYGVLVVAMRDGVWRGFVYAIRYKDFAYYFSAATLDEDLNHALLWTLIRTLRQDGVTRYLELGEAAASDAPDKERSIAFFKSGWGATLWPVPVVEPICA